MGDPAEDLSKPKWPRPTERKPFDVNYGGKDPTGKTGPLQTWNSGDIDFDIDGSIFIRNPYLANAIEELLKENHIAWQRWKDRGGKGDEPILFRLTRDEGWSGEKQNIVC